MYQLNINTLINWLLPSPIRKEKLVHWLNVLLESVQALNNSFVLFTTATKNELMITGQVTSLQFHLNRLWSPVNNHIHITDAVSSDQVFIYLESENQPLYLPKYVSGQTTDFVVHLSNDLPPEEAAIKAFLDKYKLPTKRYELIYDIIVI